MRLCSLVEVYESRGKTTSSYLLISHHHLVIDPIQGADSLYVGETESISQRIHQHRTSKKNKRNEISVAVATVQSKSAARATETLLIQSLKKNGYDVVQDSDSSHRLFGSATIPAVRADELS